MESLRIYYPAKGFEDSKVNALELSVHYNKDSYNYFTYNQKKRGYYFGIQPMGVNRHNGYVSYEFTAFTGYSYLLTELKRNSKKAYEDACEYLRSDEAKRMVKRAFPDVEIDYDNPIIEEVR